MTGLKNTFFVHGVISPIVPAPNDHAAGEFSSKQVGVFVISVGEYSGIFSWMTPSTTRTAYAVTHEFSVVGRAIVPVSRFTFHACSGHTTAEPATIPSASGPPLCGQRLSIATKRSPRLKIAISRLPICTERPSRGGTSLHRTAFIQWF